VNNKSSPLVPLCRIWQRTSQRGTTYFVGRLGSARIVLMERRDNDNDASDHTHTLFVSEATASQQHNEDRR
jgi:hypothetical protein